MKDDTNENNNSTDSPSGKRNNKSTVRKTKQKKKKPVHIKCTVRDVTLADVSVIFHLGEKIFTASKSQSHYRSWDQFTVLEFFNGDTEYCIVAEVDSKVVGFCMGTTIQKSGEKWKYGVRIC